MDAIADTSVLVAFSAARQLDLRELAFPSIGIPPAVYDELIVRGTNWRQAEAVQKVIERDGFVRLVTPTAEYRPPPAGPRRGRGEREVIALALTLNLPALIDDNLARQLAVRAGVRLVIGTLGILARAKDAGYVAITKPIIMEMVREGIRFSDPLIRKFLERMDEM